MCIFASLIISCILSSLTIIFVISFIIRFFNRYYFNWLLFVREFCSHWFCLWIQISSWLCCIVFSRLVILLRIRLIVTKNSAEIYHFKHHFIVIVFRNDSRQDTHFTCDIIWIVWWNVFSAQLQSHCRQKWLHLIIILSEWDIKIAVIEKRCSGDRIRFIKHHPFHVLQQSSQFLNFNRIQQIVFVFSSLEMKFLFNHFSQMFISFLQMEIRNEMQFVLCLFQWLQIRDSFSQWHHSLTIDHIIDFFHTFSTNVIGRENFPFQSQWQSNWYERECNKIFIILTIVGGFSLWHHIQQFPCEPIHIRDDILQRMCQEVWIFELIRITRLHQSRYGDEEIWMTPGKSLPKTGVKYFTPVIGSSSNICALWPIRDFVFGVHPCADEIWIKLTQSLNNLFVLEWFIFSFDDLMEFWNFIFFDERQCHVKPDYQIEFRIVIVQWTKFQLLHTLDDAGTEVVPTSMDVGILEDWSQSGVTRLLIITNEFINCQTNNILDIFE